MVVATLSIDMMHRTIGMPPAPLPQPSEGSPKRQRPSMLDDIGAWLPVQSKDAPIMRELLAEAMRISNVARGLSLSPRAMRDQVRLVPAQYVPITHMTSMTIDFRGISRAQMELIAGRVSVLNECFY